MAISGIPFSMLLILLVAGAADNEPGLGDVKFDDIHHQCAESGLCDSERSDLQAGSRDGSSIMRAAVPGGGRLLVLYQYYETPRAAQNLRFFLAKTVYEPAQQHGNAQTQGVDDPQGGLSENPAHLCELRLRGACRGNLVSAFQEHMTHSRKESITFSS